MDKTRFNRLWLLFAVFATALAWTWSQVFQHDGERGEIDGEPVELLRVEAGCDLARGPCAAYAGALGVVASARVDGDGVRWRVRALGEALPALPEISMTLYWPGAQGNVLEVLRVGNEWQAFSPGLVPSGSVLRVRLAGDELPMVAEFPLLGGG